MYARFCYTVYCLQNVQTYFAPQLLIGVFWKSWVETYGMELRISWKLLQIEKQWGCNNVITVEGEMTEKVSRPPLSRRNSAGVGRGPRANRQALQKLHPAINPSCQQQICRARTSCRSAFGQDKAMDVPSPERENTASTLTHFRTSQEGFVWLHRIPFHSACTETLYYSWHCVTSGD